MIIFDMIINHGCRLRLKTILSLIPDKITPEMQLFCDENNIHLLHLNVDKMKEDNIPLTYNKTIMALEVCLYIFQEWKIYDTN